MAINKEQTVLIHYTLKNEAGEVLDSSEGRDPLEFVYGAGMIIAGLENALADKNKGDKFNVIIPPEDAYGAKQDELIQDVPLTQFQDKDSVQVGVQFQTDGPQQAIATVVAVTDEIATLDMNHPLVDQTLYFDVEVVDVREPKSE